MAIKTAFQYRETRKVPGVGSSGEYFKQVNFYCKWQHFHIQSTLGFETLDKAAALGLATATPLTDPRQYINSNLGFSNLKI